MTVVTGATGILGTALCNILQREKIPFAIAGRKKIEGAAFRWLDLKEKTGINECLQNAEVVYHLASATGGRYDRAVDVDGTRALVESALRNGTRHFIYISIVGTDLVDMKYYNIKAETEQVVKQSGINYTILRATQFHELMDKLFSQWLKYPASLLAKQLKFQPIETRTVANKLFDISKTPALNGTINMGGKEILTSGVMAQQWVEARLESKWMLGVPNIGSAMKSVAAGRLTCNEIAGDSMTWNDWLKQKYSLN